jgi:hypothetical protein
MRAYSYRGFFLFFSVIVSITAVVGILVSFSFSDDLDSAEGIVTSEEITLSSKEKVSESPAVIPESVQVPILVYHHVRPIPAGLSVSERQYSVSPEEFESHLSYLRDNNFKSIRLTDIRDALKRGESLPEKPVVITFDDGRENQYVYAFPLLKEYGFSATFFPFTNAIGRPDYVTWEQLAELRDAGNEIGSHAVFHPYMTRLSDSEMRREAGDSRSVLRE